MIPWRLNVDRRELTYSDYSSYRSSYSARIRGVNFSPNMVGSYSLVFLPFSSLSVVPFLLFFISSQNPALRGASTAL